jgi:hypothetical protein
VRVPPAKLVRVVHSSRIIRSETSAKACVTQQAARVSLPILQRCGPPHCGSIAGECLAIATMHAVHID